MFMATVLQARCENKSWDGNQGLEGRSRALQIPLTSTQWAWEISEAKVTKAVTLPIPSIQTDIPMKT